MPVGQINQSAVMAALAEFQDPETGRGIVQMEQVRDVQIEGNTLALTLALTTHSAPLWHETKTELEHFLKHRFPSLAGLNIKLAVHIRPPQKLGSVGLAAKSVIAVGSGKGGRG